VVANVWKLVRSAGDTTRTFRLLNAHTFKYITECRFSSTRKGSTLTN